MKTRTKSKLAAAVRSVAVVSPLFVAGAAGAAINGPYSLDGNTAYLFHLDEAPGASIAANQQTVYNNAIGFQQTSATVAGAVNTTILGAAGRTGFGNAATFSGNLMLGYDGDGNGAYAPDIGAPTVDAVASSLFTDVGGSGAFTLEAMVSFTGNLVGGGNREIISFDSSAGTAAQRGFQFRLNNAGQIEYNSIGDGDGGVVAAVPTTGANAYAANTWFHVAMVYDGNGNAAASSVRLYWTKVDDAALQANLIGTGSEGDLPANNNMLVLGNENRNTAGEALVGLLDEVRISNVPRAANQMMFSGAILNYWNNAGGGDWDAAGNWTTAVPNAPASVAILGGGPTATTADSIITLNGTKTVGSLTFDNGFKFTLASGAAGALSLNNGAGVASAINSLSGSHEIAVPVTVGAPGVTVTTGATSTLTVSGNVGGAGAISKTGSGTLVLSGTNNYSGATTVTDGVLRATDGVGLPSTSNLVLNGGIFEPGADFARVAGTAAGQIQINGGATGFSANGAPIQVAIGSIASPAAIQWGSATFNPSTLVLNAASANNTIEFKNAIDLNGAARTVAVNANVATISGTLTDSGAGGGLTKTGAARSSSPPPTPTAGRRSSRPATFAPMTARDSRPTRICRSTAGCLRPARTSAVSSALARARFKCRAATAASRPTARTSPSRCRMAARRCCGAARRSIRACW
jgi:autotransporter-associated beta strand protein